tara:strand:- start:15969 stop:16265 length:297 start_codon:yes stop_codon:yes gene_type:complete
MTYKSSRQILQILRNDLANLSYNQIKDLITELKESLKEEESVSSRNFNLRFDILNTIKANVKNDKLTDSDFRDFVFNSIEDLDTKRKNDPNSGNFFEC